MKKLSLILLALLVSLFASAQTIEKTYYFGQPNLIQIQGYDKCNSRIACKAPLRVSPRCPGKASA